MSLPAERAEPAPEIGSTRTSTIMIADLVCSTETRAEIGDPAADLRWLAIEHSLVRAVAQCDGRVIKTVGDSVIAVFESASAGLLAAVESMRATTGYEIRIGVATGDVAFVHHDVFGTPAVVASRLCDAARPSEILATDLVLAVAGTRFPVEPAWTEPLELKGLPEPVVAVAIPWTAADDDVAAVPADQPTRATQTVGRRHLRHRAG